jgi:archaeosine-15-forming tRNA-guanine transglycosylase
LHQARVRNETARLESISRGRGKTMTVHDNPVERIVVVRKIDGNLVVDVQGTERVPIKLKPISVPVPKTSTIFPVCSVEMGSLHTSPL